MKRHSDHHYIEALAGGDHSVLEMFYKKHLPQVTSWITKNNGTTADAKDIFQEAIIAMYNKAVDPDFELSCPIGAFIFQICRNKWISQLRLNNRMKEVIKVQKERYDDNSDMIAQIEQVEMEEIRQTKLDKAFNQLSELCKKLLQYTSKGLKPNEISSKLQMAKVSTFYRRKNACIERWKTLYNNEN